MNLPKRNGLIPMRKGEEEPRKPSEAQWLNTLTGWLRILADTFPKSSLGKDQIKGYEIGLEELSEHELNIGFRRALRIWKFTVMPPPAYIRECAAAMLEQENIHKRAEEQKAKEYTVYRRLTLEEAWEDWEEVQRVEEEWRARFGRVKAEKKPPPRPEAELVLATNERLRELEAQKKQILEGDKEKKQE